MEEVRLANVVVLRIEYADGRSEERAFPAGRFTVGRDGGDVVLGGDSKVSATHAQLEIGSGRVTIRDLGSRNGTLDARGQRLTGAHALSLDQPVRLGLCSLTLLRLLGTSANEASPAAVGSPVPAGEPRSAAGGAGARRPSITRARFEGARRELELLRWLVRAAGLVLVGALLFTAASLGSGNDPATFVGGLSALASGAMLARLVKRRDEASTEYRKASLAAALCAGISDSEPLRTAARAGDVAPARQRWRQMRRTACATR